MFKLYFHFIFILFLASAASAYMCINLFIPKKLTPYSSVQGFLPFENQKMYYRLDVPPGIVRSPRDEVYLLIHGLLANSSYLDGVAAQLVAAGKTVLRVDLLGHGRSLLNSETPSGTIEEQARAISQILFHLSISNLTIYGHSLGGGVALQTALTAPQVLNGRININRLIIDEPYLYPVEKWMIEQSGANMTNVQALNPFTYVDFFLGAAFSTDSARKAFPQGFANAIRRYPKYFAVRDLSPEDQAAGAVAVFPTEDMRPKAAQITIPTTLIRGQFAPAVAPKELMDAAPSFFSIPIEVKVAKSADPHHHPFLNPLRVSRIILGLD